jgi:hypothetical protein
MATSRLKGGPELQARLRAIRTTFKPIGREWADKTARAGQGMVPVRTGRLKGSIKRRNATLKHATVVAHYTAYFVDAGTRRHTIVPRNSGRLVFSSGGRTVFARKVDHPATRPQPFRRRAALEGMRETPMAQKMIDLWNSARAAR